MLAKLESISGIRCERTSLVAKYKMLLNYIKLHRQLQKTNMTAKHGILKGS